MSDTGPETTPRVLVDIIAAAESDGRGAVWTLDPSDRDLDANLIALPAGDAITPHRGPALDVLVHVVAGSGRLETDGGPVDLRPGTVAWLPRGTVRGFTAGPTGLRYLTVHRRRHDGGLSTIGPPPSASPAR